MENNKNTDNHDALFDNILEEYELLEDNDFKKKKLICSIYIIISKIYLIIRELYQKQKTKNSELM